VFELEPLLGLDGLLLLLLLLLLEDEEEELEEEDITIDSEESAGTVQMTGCPKMQRDVYLQLPRCC